MKPVEYAVEGQAIFAFFLFAFLFAETFLSVPWWQSGVFKETTVNGILYYRMKMLCSKKIDGMLYQGTKINPSWNIKAKSLYFYQLQHLIISAPALVWKIRLLVDSFLSNFGRAYFCNQRVRSTIFLNFDQNSGLCSFEKKIISKRVQFHYKKLSQNLFPLLLIPYR